MERQKVIFVCIHNSARSQMAETFLNALGNEHFEAQSAGIEKGNLNPIVVEAMKEYGFDISKNQTKVVDDFIRSDLAFDFVITVCDETSAERCPVFPGKGKRLHWSFPDPSQFTGTFEEKLALTRKVRDEIKNRVEKFIRKDFDSKI